MASEEPGGKPPSKPPRGSYLPTWGRLAEFVLNMLKLESSVEALKKDNQELDQRIRELQKQVYEQSGQLKVLSDFVNKALEDHVRSTAEEAAVRAFERMATFAALLPEQNQGEEDK
jgi:predicted RNase H-like nuclease (RuvC/YqgF family)